MNGPMTALVLFLLAAVLCTVAVFPAMAQLNDIPDSFKGWAWVRRGRFILLRAVLLLVVAALLAANSLLALVPSL